MAYKKIDNNDLIGLKVGKLTVISIAYKKNSAWHYNCDCDCGKSTVVVRGSLKHNKQKSCGCSLEEYRVRMAKDQIGKPSKNSKAMGESSFNAVMNGYIQSARKRGLEFLLTKDEFMALIKDDCHYCGSEPSTVTKHACAIVACVHNGVDRVDSDIGYKTENCVTCCKKCNYMKLLLSKPDFLEHVEKISQFQKLKSRHENNS